MSKKFETPKNLEREERAIKLWTKREPNDCYEKLGEFDPIDYRVFSKKTNTFAYVEIKGRHKNIKDAYSLPISARKLCDIYETLKNDPKTEFAFVIWACDDGIIVGNIEDLIGKVRIGGRSKREGSSNDVEVMAYYKKQSALKEKMY